MNEFPVFIPVGDEHVSAVVTIPDGEARGVVLLLPGGGGAPRSHRFAMWTKAARGLAERGIASLRADWRGVGDSTGVASFSFKALPVEDTVAVARFAVEATGSKRLGVAGNCAGARTLLAASDSLPFLSSAVLILLKPLAHTRSKRPLVRRGKALAERVPAVRRVAKRVYGRVKWRQATPMMSRLAALQRRADLLMMESDTWKAGKLPRSVEAMQRRNGEHRIELRDLPGGTARAFHSLERQGFVIDSVVGWFDETFPRAGQHAADERDTVPASHRNSG